MSWKHAIWKLLGKEPDAVVVSFLSGPESLARAMLAEVRSLVPDRQHYAVTDLRIDGVQCIPPRALPGPLRRKRIGLAPTLFTSDPEYASLRRLAFRIAPGRVLAYNSQLERHHLRLRTPVASSLFLKGVPLDRIWLRPKWLFPLRKDRSVQPSTHQIFEGRALRQGKPRIGILTPYFPYPLSHGGAVRIFNLIREGARDYDIFLFSFVEKASNVAQTPVLDFCSQVIAFPHPRYREPRWSSWHPPEVDEFTSSYVRGVLEDVKKRFAIQLLQVEYTQLAAYAGDILVEHDVTFDLHEQIVRERPSASANWDLQRWVRFEKRAVRTYRRVVVMSDKDAALLGGGTNLRVIPNGVDIKRFQPQPETTGRQILFVGSFRHFPNVVAYRWFIERVWPILQSRMAGLRFVTIAGPTPEQYYPNTPVGPDLELHGFVSDVRPFYANCNVVIVPTRVSAGTNLKVLEAMACERAVVSTTSGCAGLGLESGTHILVADDPEAFATEIERLLEAADLRQKIARAGRIAVEDRFDWRNIGRLQNLLWSELLTGIRIRPGQKEDVGEIQRIQMACHTASHWDPASYFDFEVRIAERERSIVAFMVTRDVVGETEVLNLAVSPDARRAGVATALLHSVHGDEIFLEVRESNLQARKLYEKLGFLVVGKREEYYDDPVETAIVMRLSRTSNP